MLRQSRAAVLALCALGGCVPHTPEPNFDTEELSQVPVGLRLQDADGEAVHLPALRGRPLLIFVFTTYDDVSHLALSLLEQHLTQAPFPTLGLAVQPDADRLLPLYRDSLGVSFPLTSDPEGRVLRGESALGRIETVPTYFVLDRAGRVVARHTGALDKSGLAELLEEADSR